jgi:hypothetical protein|nr:MAG TPA: hypothetical protein [Caudoviricetes sp.]
MTVGNLKAMLDEYDDDMKIVFQPYNSMYGERIGDIEEGNGIATYYGKNYKSLILTSDGQCGAVCSECDLDLEEKE